jgi:predicted CoA-binding protein
MIWKGYATSAQFRDANERVLLEIQQRRSSKLLGDAKEFVLIGATDQSWLSSNWIPRVLQAGVRKIALVMPRFYFNRVAVDAVTQRLAQNVANDLVSIEYFESRDAARAWLSAV